MPESPEQYAARLRRAQAELIRQLQAAVTDRPAHALFLDALLQVPVDTFTALTLPAGLSTRVADALLDDVTWLRQEPPQDGEQISAYPDTYRQLRAYYQRISVKSQASQKARREGTAPSLRKLLDLH